MEIKSVFVCVCEREMVCVPQAVVFIGWKGMRLRGGDLAVMSAEY